MLYISIYLYIITIYVQWASYIVLCFNLLHCFIFQINHINKENDAIAGPPESNDETSPTEQDRGKGSKTLKEKFLKAFKLRKTPVKEGEASTKAPTVGEKTPTTTPGIGEPKKTTDVHTRCESEEVCGTMTIDNDDMRWKLYANNDHCSANLIVTYLKNNPKINYLFVDELFLRASYRQEGRNDFDLLNECITLKHIKGAWLSLHRSSALGYSKYSEHIKTTSFESNFKTPNLLFNLRNPAYIQEKANRTLPKEEKSKIQIPKNLFKGLKPKVYRVSRYEVDEVITKFEESLNYCQSLTTQEGNVKILIIFGELGSPNGVLIRNVFKTTLNVASSNNLNVYCHLSDEDFLKALKEVNEEWSKHDIPSKSERKNMLMEHNPPEFQDKGGILFTNFQLSEGFEFPNVISLYGNSNSVNTYYSDNNLNNRSTANLIVFQGDDNDSDSDYADLDESD